MCHTVKDQYCNETHGYLIYTIEIECSLLCYMNYIAYIVQRYEQETILHNFNNLNAIIIKAHGSTCLSIRYVITNAMCIRRPICDG